MRNITYEGPSTPLSQELMDGGVILLDSKNLLIQQSIQFCVLIFQVMVSMKTILILT